LEGIVKSGQVLDLQVALAGIYKYYFYRKDVNK